MQKAKRKKTMLKNMLKNLNLTAEQFLGPVGQFIDILLGESGIRWWTDFKKFLREEIFKLHLDLTFDPGKEPDKLKSKLWSPKKVSSPAEIWRNIRLDGFRMGTSEELVSFMGFILANAHTASVMVFSDYGPEGIPCALLFSKRGSCIELRLMSNHETAVWQPGCQFLVFPAKN